MAFPSNITLVKIAAIGGVLTTSMGLAYRWKLNDNISKTQYFKEAMQLLQSHKAAVHLLGEPIKSGTIDMGDDRTNWTKVSEAQYAVPVRGVRKKGILYFWAQRSNENDVWNVNRIELELKDLPGKRLVIKNDRQF